MLLNLLALRGGVRGCGVLVSFTALNEGVDFGEEQIHVRKQDNAYVNLHNCLVNMLIRLHLVLLVSRKKKKERMHLRISEALVSAGATYLRKRD